MVRSDILDGAHFRVYLWTPDSSRLAGGLFKQFAQNREDLLGWLKSQGYRMHAFSLFDKNRKVVSYLPPEFLRRLVAPVLVRLLYSLCPADNWTVVLISLMGVVGNVFQHVAQWRSVEPIFFTPEPPHTGLLRCHGKHALHRIMPLLFGDATEIIFLPEKRELSSSALMRLLFSAADLQDFKSLICQASLWAALLRDSTVLEIVSPFTRREIESYIKILNKMFHYNLLINNKKIYHVLEKYGDSVVTQVEKKACEEARCHTQQFGWDFSLGRSLTESATEKMESEVLGFHVLRNNLVEFYCKVKLQTSLTKSTHWVTVRVLFRDTGGFAFKAQHVSAWYERRSSKAKDV